MEGIVFDIQRFSLNDGPGIRTIVFLKGCMLDCKWCHNPESKSNKQQLKYIENKCIQCQKCESVCKYGVHSFANGHHNVDFTKCKMCKKCIDICCTDALSIVGKKVSAKSVVDVLEKDRKYYEKSGGGITISGGEALYQPDFAISIAREAKKRNLHVVVETSGFGNPDKFKELSNYVDQFYFDCKHTDEKLHKKYVGVGLKVIEENRNYLRSINKTVVLRCPLIPGYNWNEEHFRGIVSIYKANPNISRVEVLPYHSLGKSKAENIGTVYDMPEIPTPSKEDVERAIEKLKQLGIDNIRKG